MEPVRRAVPRPTTEQCRAYAQRVSGHHSWYKHLPLVEPGEPFLLYLHPRAQEVYVDREGSAGAWRRSSAVVSIAEADPCSRWVCSQATWLTRCCSRSPLGTPEG